MIHDDPELLDDDGKVPKSEENGWRFDSQLWNLLSIYFTEKPRAHPPQGR